RVAPLRRGGQRLRIQDVARHGLDRPVVAVARLPRVAREDGDLVPAVEQAIDEVGPDEPGPSGDENLHWAAGSITVTSPSRVSEQIARDPLALRAHREDLAARLREAAEILQRIRDSPRRQARRALAEQVAGSARLEILLGDGEAVGRLLERREAGPRLGRRAPADDECAPRLAVATSDAAAELVELREPEALRVLDDHEC